jgi:hypothetical protein
MQRKSHGKLLQVRLKALIIPAAFNIKTTAVMVVVGMITVEAGMMGLSLYFHHPCRIWTVL